MKRFVQGMDRGQATLLPECLDDWIGEDNAVRVNDAFVDAGHQATARGDPGVRARSFASIP